MDLIIILKVLIAQEYFLSFFINLLMLNMKLFLAGSPLLNPHLLFSVLYCKFNLYFIRYQNLI